MNAFAASRVGAAAVIASPAIFLVLIYTAASRDPLAVVAQVAFFYSYLVAVALFVPIKPVIGVRWWLVWIVLSAALAIPPAAAHVAAGLRSGGVPRDVSDTVVNFVFAAVIGAAAAGVWLRARRFDRAAALDLAFPLSGGLFVAIQAGSSRLLNHHVRSRAQRYGVDLVNADNVPTYALPVHAAVAGTVVEAVDGFDDNSAGLRDVRHPFGNHVVVEDAAGRRTYFAHLKRGSVGVRAGASVRVGDVLGLVGNSGNSTEPHLHVHAERCGDGLPITFGGRYLIRNSSVRAT